MKYLFLTAICAAATILVAHIISSVVTDNFTTTIHAMSQTGVAPPMTHTELLTYLLAAGAFAAPTIRAVQYLVALYGTYFPYPKNASSIERANLKRTYAAIIGAVLLPLVNGVFFFFAPVIASFDFRVIPFDIIVGAAAGLAAAGDYDLFDAINKVESGGSPVTWLSGTVTTTPLAEIKPTPPIDPPPTP